MGFLEREPDAGAQEPCLIGGAEEPAAVNEGAEVGGDPVFEADAEGCVAVVGLSKSCTAACEGVGSEVEGFNRVAHDAVAAEEVIPTVIVGIPGVFDADTEVAGEDAVDGESAAGAGVDRLPVGLAGKCLQEESIHLEFHIPEEGGICWADVFEGFSVTCKGRDGDDGEQRKRCE